MDSKKNIVNINQLIESQEQKWLRQFLVETFLKENWMLKLTYFYLNLFGIVD